MSTTTQKLNGKVAVITGGSSGIGLATAQRFAAEGAHVFITGRRKDALDTAVAQIGKNVIGVRGDVANRADLDGLYNEVKKQNRKIDILFANAGVVKRAPFGAVTEEFFDFHFNVNVRGLFFTVQKALPLLNDGASIILTGSIASIKGFPAFSVYSATKAVVRCFARSWTNHLKDRYIRVNVLSPGHTDTPIHESFEQGEALIQMKKRMVEDVPLRRLGTPEDIANACLFLASGESSYVTGIELFVDGGVAQI
jgi:NAD(P)-dependent dehydrogenase (short-subunit alcohol dehydrogenase family)